MKNKITLIILSFLILSCQSKNEDNELIYIKNNWEIDGLELNKSTIKDVEEYAKSKKILLKKDSVSFFQNLPDTIEYCGNDYRLHEVSYQLKNDSLGINFNFKQQDKQLPILFTDYNISKFENVRFEKGFTTTISKEILDANFKGDKNLNLYENISGKNTALLGVIQKNAITYEVKALNVYQN